MRRCRIQQQPPKAALVPHISQSKHRLARRRAVSLPNIARKEGRNDAKNDFCYRSPCYRFRQHSGRADAESTSPLKGDVLGSFFFHACPAEAPVGALCLHDDVTGTLTHLGRMTGSFEVVFDVAQFGEDGADPYERRGALPPRMEIGSMSRLRAHFVLARRWPHTNFKSWVVPGDLPVPAAAARG